MEVGIIGIGIMGRAMARSLLRAGFRVWVWNRTRSKAEALAQEGAILAGTPGELVKNVKIVGVVLANHEVTREVFYKKEGVLEGIHEGVYIVDHGTNSPEWAFEAYEEVENRGGKYIDIPVLGSKIQAENGELVILAGGNEEELKGLKNYLSVLGKRIIYTGKRGNGCLLKLNLNLMIAIMNLAVAEGIALSEAFGLKPEFFMDALLHSAMASPYIKIKGEKILKQDFSKQFALSLMTKDLRLIMQEVIKHRFPSFLGSICYDVYQQAEVKGLGEVDLSAVKKMYQEK